MVKRVVFPHEGVDWSKIFGIGKKNRQAAAASKVFCFIAFGTGKE
jgi:hypothetical protein